MAAIERLMNRKVESRAVPGFEPGSASRRPPVEHKHPRQSHAEPRRQRPQGRGGRPESRSARPESRSARPESRNARPERHSHKERHAHTPPNAPHALERDAQIREARARMAAEGEKPLPTAAPKRTLGQRIGALLGGAKREAS